MKVLPLLAFALLAGAAAPVAPLADAPPKLSFPLACALGRTCEIQHYYDRDPGPGTRDYRCGLQTYEKHDGIDIRLPDMAAERRGVNVLAAAPGRVARLRDGVADVSIRAPGAPSVAGQECGNGVVVDHGGGWETQYCHMAKGSIVVKVGDQVQAGTPLGHVGLSGDTEFPHLHFTLRKVEGRASHTVDPFAPQPDTAGACRAQAGFWSAQALAKMPYHAGAILNAGFADRQLTMDDVENGGVAPPKADSPVLIVYARAIALLPGDETELDLKGPGGLALHDRKPPLQRWRAQDLFFIGKKRPPTGWPSGLYTADYRVWRKGKVALSRHLELRL